MARSTDARNAERKQLLRGTAKELRNTGTILLGRRQNNMPKYDNSIVFSDIIGCTLDQLYDKAQQIINGPERFFDDLLPAYPYTITNE